MRACVRLALRAIGYTLPCHGRSKCTHAVRQPPPEGGEVRDAVYLMLLLSNSTKDIQPGSMVNQNLATPAAGGTTRSRMQMHTRSYKHTSTSTHTSASIHAHTHTCAAHATDTGTSPEDPENVRCSPRRTRQQSGLVLQIQYLSREAPYE